MFYFSENKAVLSAVLCSSFSEFWASLWPQGNSCSCCASDICRYVLWCWPNTWCGTWIARLNPPTNALGLEHAVAFRIQPSSLCTVHFCWLTQLITCIRLSSPNMISDSEIDLKGSLLTSTNGPLSHQKKTSGHRDARLVLNLKVPWITLNDLCLHWLWSPYLYLYFS